MLLLDLTDSEMKFITEISKGLFPLLAAMTGAYLTYRFQKRDKIRDHLYGYKVKAYSKIAKTIHDIKNNYSYACGDILGNELPLQNYKTPVEVYDLFNNVSSEDALYLTKTTLKDIDNFEKKYIGLQV